MKRPILTLAVLLLFAVQARAQDPAVVDSDHYKVEFENDQIRVLRITYGVGEKSVMHDHPDGVAIMLTDGTFLMTMPNGESAEYVNSMGSVSWAPGGPHLPANIGGDRSEVILVELKHACEMDHDDGDDDDE